MFAEFCCIDYDFFAAAQDFILILLIYINTWTEV